jgi:hypothetical protein
LPGQDVVRLEARRNGHHTLKTEAEQTRSGQQNKRQGNLRDDKTVTQDLSAVPARAATALRLKRISEMPPKMEAGDGWVCQSWSSKFAFSEPACCDCGCSRSCSTLRERVPVGYPKHAWRGSVLSLVSGKCCQRLSGAEAHWCDAEVRRGRKAPKACFTVSGILRQEIRPKVPRSRPA